MRIVAVFCIDVEKKKYWYKCDLSSFSYFNRSSINELLCEFATFAAESLDNDPERKTFEHRDFLLCCHRIGDLVTALFTDLEYPTRCTFELLRRVHEDASEEHMGIILTQCQHANTVDALTRAQCQLDETLVIMHENVTKILQRGDDIDALVEKSARLSVASKTFYKVARKHNRCCAVQ